jgi:phospholipid/cholesterol/gamma-HCH transport system substrate-binding protein
MGTIDMENTARITGYCVILAFLAGLLLVVLTLRQGLLFPHNRIKVNFPTVGTLMEDDPVKLQGVEIGRVEHIESGPGTAIATLEIYKRTTFPKDTRFINYNYSLFGARMIILVPGQSTEPMDQNQSQQGDFSTGITETIHLVGGLLKTVTEYQKLAVGLEHGNDSTPSLQHLLTTQVYPVLEDFNRFAGELEGLQMKTEKELERLTKASNQVNRFSQAMVTSTDTMVIGATRTLEQLARLTVKTTSLLQGLEKMMIAVQDTTSGPGRILMQRQLYDQSMSLTHSLLDLLKLAKKDGLKDAIHFWRNVRLHP